MITTDDNRDDRAVVEALRRVVAAPTEADLAVHHSRFRARADREGLVDVAYDIADSPFGALLVAATPEGLVRVAFACEDHDAVLGQLAANVSPRVLRLTSRTDLVARQLDEYFAGTRRSFDVPLDLRLVHGFRRTVLDRLADIAYGTTATYTSIAALVGKPGAARAVGSACSHNPVPLVLPCHRVVRSDGMSGHYLGGAITKVALLAFERAARSAATGGGQVLIG